MLALSNGAVKTKRCDVCVIEVWEVMHIMCAWRCLCPIAVRQESAWDGNSMQCSVDGVKGSCKNRVINEKLWNVCSSYKGIMTALLTSGEWLWTKECSPIASAFYVENKKVYILYYSVVYILFQWMVCGANGHHGQLVILTVSTIDAEPVINLPQPMVVFIAMATTLTQRTVPMECAEVRLRSFSI